MTSFKKKSYYIVLRIRNFYPNQSQTIPYHAILFIYSAITNCPLKSLHTAHN